MERNGDVDEGYQRKVQHLQLHPATVPQGVGGSNDSRTAHRIFSLTCQISPGEREKCSPDGAGPAPVSTFCGSTRSPRRANGRITGKIQTSHRFGYNRHLLQLVRPPTWSSPRHTTPSTYSCRPPVGRMVWKRCFTRGDGWYLTIGHDKPVGQRQRTLQNGEGWATGADIHRFPRIFLHGRLLISAFTVVLDYTHGARHTFLSGD